MILQDIRKYNAVYHKDCSLNWLEIGEKVGKHRRKKKVYPMVGLDKIVVPEEFPIDQQVLEQSIKAFYETGELIPVYLSFDMRLIGGFEQYEVAKQLHLYKVPMQRVTRKEMNKREQAAFRKTVHNRAIGNKKYPLYATDGSEIYVSLNVKKKVTDLFRKVKKMNYHCHIFPNFQFAITDIDGNYIVGSPNRGASLTKASKKIDKMKANGDINVKNSTNKTTTNAAIGKSRKCSQSENT